MAVVHSQIRGSLPYTNEVVAEVCTPAWADIKQAIEASVRGFALMRRLPAHRRSSFLFNLHTQLKERAEEMVTLLCLEGGKTQKVAQSEVARAPQTVLVASERSPTNRRRSGAAGLDTRCRESGRMDAAVSHWPYYLYCPL